MCTETTTTVQLWKLDRFLHNLHTRRSENCWNLSLHDRRNVNHQELLCGISGFLPSSHGAYLSLRRSWKLKSQSMNEI